MSQNTSSLYPQHDLYLKNNSNNNIHKVIKVPDDKYVAIQNGIGDVNPPFFYVIGKSRDFVLL